MQLEEEQGPEEGQVCAYVTINLDPLRRLPGCGPSLDSPATLWKWSPVHSQDVSKIVARPRRRVEEWAVGTRGRTTHRSCHPSQLKILDARTDSK